jgi:hypothetical protein
MLFFAGKRDLRLNLQSRGNIQGAAGGVQRFGVERCAGNPGDFDVSHSRDATHLELPLGLFV